MKVPRPYQRAATEAIQREWASGNRRTLLVMPTGTGKTFTFADLIKQTGKKALVLAHRSELLHQSAKAIESHVGCRVEIDGGEFKSGPMVDVVVASVQSVGKRNTKRLEGFHPDVVIIDEAHHAPADSYQAVMERFGCYADGALCVGVTATPHRLDNRPLHGDCKAIFQSVAFTYTIREAMKDQFLCDLKGKFVDMHTSLAGIKVTGGDYASGELAKAVNTPERNWAAYQAWKELASDARTIVFCAGVEHAETFAMLLRNQGVRARSVDGSMEREERDRVINQFRYGEIQVLTNCEIATEGFDVPEIECVLLLRPTKSWALYTQMVGRGLRLSYGKESCLVIDCTDNYKDHSLASVPALVGLPPAIDLEGRTVREAVEVFETLDERSQRILLASAASFGDLKTVTGDISLLDSIESELQSLSGLSWVKVTDDLHVLRLGKSQEGYRRALRVQANTLGQWKVSTGSGEKDDWFNESTEDRFAITSFDSLSSAAHEAEMAARKHGWVLKNLADQNAAWRSDPPTEKQLAILKRKCDPDILRQITKGEASKLISQIFAAKNL